jgi:hypothetical protein
MGNIELKLELLEQNTAQKLNKDGDNIQRFVARFKARDVDHGVDWTLTLSTEDNLPAAYRKIVGETNGSEIFVTVRSATQQGKLSEA